MYPFWVEVPIELLVELAAAGLTGLVCLVQTFLMTR